MTWPDAFFVTYEYDVTGNVTKIRENGAASGIGVLAQYSYDNLGRRTGIVRGNGKNTAIGFDTAGRLSGLGHDFADVTKDVQWAFGTNAAGQIKDMARNNDAYAWGGHYNVERGYTANGLNQYSQIARVGHTPDVPSYDLRGNITAVGGVSYAYNSLNQLTSVSSSAQVGYNGTLTYDPAGRLAKLIAGSTTLQMLYAGDALLGEKDGAGTLLRRYVHGPGTDEPIVWYEGAGTGDKRWLHADERGSIVAVSDASGAVIGINRYDEYGNGLAGNVGRFRYTGQAGFEEIGLLNYKARFYSPGLGRFLQTDPIGYGDGLNWYNYVGSDPVNKVDPSGLGEVVWTCTITGATFGDMNWVCEQQIVVTADRGGLGWRSGRPDDRGPNPCRDFGICGRDDPRDRDRPSKPQSDQSRSKFGCLANIDAATWTGLGLDAVGVVASLTGLKSAWTAGSTITGMVAGMSSTYLSAATGDGGGLGRAGFGTALTYAGSFEGASRLATNLPVVGAVAAVGVTGYDAYQALKKAGCVK